MSSPASTIAMLDATVELAAGTYRLGEAGAEHAALLPGVRVGRWPVVNASLARFVEATGRDVSPALARKLADPLLAEHPATDVTYEEAAAFCAWAAGRLPSGDEWEAAARGADGRAWPWGETFNPERCACGESGWGWTAPVTAHPAGASPCGAEQLAGNVWEWVSDEREDGWGVVRGGSYLDTQHGLHAARELPADPARATATTGFRIVFDTNERRSGWTASS